MDWTHIIGTAIPAGSAVLVGLFGLIGYLARLRAVMKATPEQIEALKKLEPPPFIIRRGGPAILLIGLSVGMAAWPTSGSAAPIEASAAPIAECNAVNCPPPHGRCVGGQCQATGQHEKQPAKMLPPKRAKAKRPAVSATAEPVIDSTVVHNRLWDSQPASGPFADRGGAWSRL